MAKLIGASFYVFVALLALVFAVGMAVVYNMDVPVGTGMAIAGGFALLVVGLQFIVSPFLIDWIMEIHWTAPIALGQDFDAWLRQTCTGLNIPVPRFGIIEDGAPNAFTYGNAAFNARVVVTRGVIDMLDVQELRAVVAHELGHIKHRDFIVMTAIQALVLALYALYVASRERGRGGWYVVIGSYIAYWLAYYISLYLSRVREYMADYASAQIMRDPNPLSTALVKIAYGLAKSQTPQQSGATVPMTGRTPYATATAGAPPTMATPTPPPPRTGGRTPYDDATINSMLSQSSSRGTGIFDALSGINDPEKQEQKAAERKREQKQKFQSSAFGAFGIASSSGMRSAVSWFGANAQPDPQNFTLAARWELYNPWAKLAELVSTHPLPAMRIRALMKLNRLWNIPPVFDFSQVKPGRYTGLARDLFVVVLPVLTTAGAIALAFAAVGTDPLKLTGAALAGYGIGSLFKTVLLYPGGFAPAKNLDLLSEVDVSHIHPIPVIIDGELTGQLGAGVPWANDFIVQDQTAFMAAIYRQPFAIFEALFGFFGAKGYVGRRVRIYGWYRRFTAPMIEIDHFTVHGSFQRVKCHFKAFKLAMSAVAVVLGGVMASGVLFGN